MRRRAFISLLGGAIALPLAARAQKSESMRRIGVLMNTSADDPEGRSQSRLSWTHCGNWVGPMAAMYGSTLAGLQAMPTSFANTRLNWLDLRRTSFSPLPARVWRRCGRPLAMCRSCSRM